MPSITLFGSRLSPFVEKVARALQLKGLAFETVDIRFPGDLKRWKPTRRKMPFFFSDRASAADLALFGQLATAASGPTPDFAALLWDRPALSGYMKRVDQATRP